MASELKKRIEERKKQKADEQLKEIIFYCPFTSEEIMKAYLPKTKNQNWYNQNCIGINEIPMKAVNGHNGGTPFYTKDKKIMRSGASTWSELEIK